MNNTHKAVLMTGLVILIPVVGYGIMQMLVYLFPMSEQSYVSHFMMTLAIIALGLVVPYWMLKGSFHVAHLNNSDERELHLRDLPKNGDEIGPHEPRVKKSGYPL